MKTKLDAVKAAMRADDWERAVALAAKFQNLGKHREAILGARSAITNPAFVVQIGKDPEELKRAGAAALKDRYPDWQQEESVPAGNPLARDEARYARDRALLAAAKGGDAEADKALRKKHRPR